MNNQSSRNTKHILFLPNYIIGNPYQTLLLKSLEEHGCKVTVSDFPSGLFSISRALHKNPVVDIIHIHWIPSLIGPISWTKGWKKELKIAFLKLDIWWVKYIRKVKIVWTIHNKTSHQNFDRASELRVRALLFKKVHARIFHSVDAETIVRDLLMIKRGYPSNVIHHGNYDGCYPKPNKGKHELRKLLAIPSEHSVILSFGMLRAYKGIDKLIQAIGKAQQPNVTLIVVGQAQEPEYEKQLTKLANTTENVKLEIRFLSDQELSNYLNMVDLVAIPFEDTLTSGSVLLAMTFGKALLVPEKAKTLGVIPEKGALFYQGPEELIEHLSGLSEYDLTKMGKINRDKADEYNWEYVGRKTTKVYQSI